MAKTRKSKKIVDDPMDPLRVSLPPMPWQFSCDVVRSDMPMKKIKVFVDGWMMRMDTIVDDVVVDIVISDPSECVTWNLLPKEKRAFPVPYPPQERKLVTTKSRPDPDQRWYWVKDGVEVIDVRECDRYLGYFDSTRERYLTTCFVDRETQMRRRMVGGTITREWLNAVVGPPDPSVFEVPAGFELR